MGGDEEGEGEGESERRRGREIEQGKRERGRWKAGRQALARAAGNRREMMAGEKGGRQGERREEEEGPVCRVWEEGESLLGEGGVQRQGGRRCR
ncbi:hypothetical protein MRB53_032890 [Persea americana]|uniref:Uncharacterized protein n=1 Tax=Persea americana TaxID=3435 RepID=A0ACC2KT66_PERAE|nr:hypothetical protein MRB53_032890 [Persea americana]